MSTLDEITQEKQRVSEALARAELEEGLLALTERLPHMQLVGERAKLVGFDGIRRCGQLIVQT